jgi:hypothetical protein
VTDRSVSPTYTLTFSFAGVLQLVCNLERRAITHNPRAYPRHHGLTFLRMEDFSRLKDHRVQLLGRSRQYR